MDGDGTAIVSGLTVGTSGQDINLNALLDHLIGPSQQGRWNVDAERLRSLEVHHQFELGRLLDRQVVVHHSKNRPPTAEMGQWG